MEGVGHRCSCTPDSDPYISIIQGKVRGQLIFCFVSSFYGALYVEMKRQEGGRDISAADYRFNGPLERWACRKRAVIFLYRVLISMLHWRVSIEEGNERSNGAFKK